jgi:hypothetical protein
MSDDSPVASQSPIGWLKAVAPPNMAYKVVAEPVFQPPMG